MSDRIRILCISPTIAPQADAEAFCGAKMVKALIDFGADVTVITSSNFNKPALKLDSSSLWQFTRSIVTDIPLPLEKERIRSMSTALRYQSFFARWLDNVVQLAKKLHRRREFDLVYSRSWPMAAHAAGYWCSRALCLPWVANANDPWDRCFWPGLQRRQGTSLDRISGSFWLQRTFRHAQLLMFPSGRLANFHFNLAGTHPATAIIPHVGCSQKNEGRGKDAAGERSIFNLVHAGKLGTCEISGRSARGLFAGLARFLDTTPEARPVVRLLLVGPEDTQTRALAGEFGLGEQVAFVGPVSYEQSLNYISEASVCVLVEADIDEGIFLPSKFVDYITARKPVLALSPSSGVVADQAGRGGIVRVDPSDFLPIANALGDLYNDFRCGTLHFRCPPEDLVNEFTPETVTRKFFSSIAQSGGSVGLKTKRLLGAYGLVGTKDKNEPRVSTRSF